MSKGNLKLNLLMAMLITGGTMCNGGALTAEAAEEAPTFSLAQMVVTAQRYETADIDTPAAVEVYDREKIEKTGASNVYDVLQNTLGVVTQSQGFNGTSMGTMTSKVMIRGVEKGTLILFNGVPLNLDGKYNLEDISSDIVERIEVVKGGGSVLYGSEATGGVINIITRKNIPNSAKVEIGNYGKERYGLNLGSEKFSMSASLENRGKAENMSGLSSGKRAGTTYYDYGKGEKKGILWNYKFNDALTFTHNYGENEHKYLQHETKAPHNGQISQINDYKDRDNNFLLNYDKDGLKATISYGTQEKEYYQEKLNSKGIITSSELYSSRKGYSTVFDLQKAFDIKNDKLIIGMDYNAENMDSYASAKKKTSSTPAQNPIDSNYKRNTYSIYASYNKALNDKANLILNLRETVANGCKGEQKDLKNNTTTHIDNDTMSKFTPEIEFIQKLTEKSSFYAKAGKSFRLPNLTQIFGSGIISPKVDLKPEQGTHYEIGYKLDDGNKAWRLSIFNYSIKDSIEANNTYDDGVLVGVDYTNQDVRNTGIELSCAITHDDNWSSNWGIMYNNPQTKAEDIYGDSQWHDYYNKLQFTGGISYKKDKLATSINANYVGKRTGNEATSREIKPQLFTDLHVAYSPEKNHKVYLHVNNLLNRQDITTNGTSNYYTLGRNFILGYEMKF